MRKVSAIICAMIIVCSLIVIPVSAIGITWGEMSNTTNRMQLGYSYRVDEDTYKSYVSERSAREMISIVQYQYEIGLYGGNIPIAIGIITNQDENENNETVYTTQGYRVYTIDQSDLLALSDKSTANLGFRLNVGENYERNFYPVNVYCIYRNGDVELISYHSNYAYIANDTTPEGLKWIAVRNNTQWTIESENPLFIESYFPNNNYTNTALNNVATIYERYLNQETPTYNYTLDIPGIITAIPNGAKQIINNAFGFEIFGINVAGLLSVLLIVAIVAFVVKWLIK